MLAEGFRKQIEELNTLATAKDKDCLAASKARREAEDALEQLKIRLEETKKSFEALRKTKATVNNSTAEDWRVSHSIVQIQLNMFANTIPSSNSLSAQSAPRTSATPHSNFVAMSSALLA